MKYHGKYCGPNWSAGKYQPSVIDDTVPPDDEFDRTCMEHDAEYATRKNNNELARADLQFARKNFLKGPKRTIAAIAVGTQGVMRKLGELAPNILIPNMSKNNLRGSAQRKAAMRKINGKTGPMANNTVSVPAVIGTAMTGSIAASRKLRDGSMAMSTRVCLGRPPGTSQATIPELLAFQYLHPVVMGNDEVQNMTRVYEKFRITKAHLTFRAFQSTGIGGEVIMVANKDPNYRPIDTTTNSSFYQRALATQYSSLAPVWMCNDMELPVDTTWKLCDNSNSTTLEEFSSGVVYILADGTTSTPGYFFVDVEIEFSGLRFNARNLISGSYLGLAAKVNASFVNPVIGAPASAAIATVTAGDIYAIILSTTSAVFGAGTASTLFTLSTGAGSVPYTVRGCTLVYGRAISATNVYLYTTYDAAVGGDAADALLYGVTVVATTTLVAAVTQLRNSTQPSL